MWCHVPEDGIIKEFRYQKGEEMLRTSKSKIKNLTSLKTLCFEKIYRKIHYFKKKEDPFSCLAGPIIKELEFFLLKKDKDLFTSSEILPLFFTPYNPYLYFDLTVDWSNEKKKNIWSKEKMNDAFNSIKAKCGERLQCLNLVMRSPDAEFSDDTKYPLPSMEVYKSLLSSLVNIKELCLDECSVDKEIIAVIAFNCPKLEILHLENNTGVNDECIDLLCKGECKLLDVLYLGEDDSRVTEEGVVNALLHLKHLTLLVHPNVLAALMTLKKRSPDMTFKLEEIMLDSKCEDLKTVNHFKELFKMLPNIQNFGVGNIPKLEPFLQLKGITGIAFNGMSLTKPKICSIIKELGKNLTSLCISIRNMKVDPALIGMHCPNLERLRWFCESPVRSTCKTNDNHFTKLKELTIDLVHNIIMLSGEIEAKPFPLPPLCAMMSSRDLEKIQIVGLSTLQRAILSLVQKAEEQPDLGIFSKLRSFVSVECPIFTLNIMVYFLCLTPHLKVFELGRSTMHDDEVRALYKFAERFAPEVKCEVLDHKGRPYESTIWSESESATDSDSDDSMDE